MFHVCIDNDFIVRSADLFWLIAVSISFQAPIYHTSSGMVVCSTG